jgi:hypothetical protein
MFKVLFISLLLVGAAANAQGTDYNNQQTQASSATIHSADAKPACPYLSGLVGYAALDKSGNPVTASTLNGRAD